MTEPSKFENQSQWNDFIENMEKSSDLEIFVEESTACFILNHKQYKTADDFLYTSITPYTELMVLDIVLIPKEGFDYAGALGDRVRSAITSIKAQAEATGCHIAGNFTHLPNVKGSEITGAIVRIFRDQDFACKGHPELLVNAPIGMYHCDKCGEMQMAGTFHLPKEETEDVQ